MRNPFRDEAAAFHLVLGTTAFLAAVVVASWIATWLGVVVFVTATVVVVAMVVRGRRASRRPPPHRRAEVEDTPGDRP